MQGNDGIFLGVKGVGLSPGMAQSHPGVSGPEDMFSGILFSAQTDPTPAELFEGFLKQRQEKGGIKAINKAAIKEIKREEWISVTHSNVS